MPGGIYQNMLPAALPPWMRGPNVSTLSESVGAQLDANAEQVMVGRLQSIVFAGGPTASRAGAARLADGRLIECEPFVLPVHAEQRGIKLYATESTLSKRIRLSRWWQIHKERGTHRGELRNLAPYFVEYPAIPRMRIVHQSNEATPTALWHTLEPDGTYSVHRASPSNWNWDGIASKKSRFWLIIYVDQLGFPAQPDWDGGQDWDGGSIWDGLFTSNQIADFVAMVQEAKGAHSILWGVIFATDPNSFDPAAAPSGAVDVVTGETPAGVAIDATHIYWADNFAGHIRRSNLDGSGKTTLVTGAGSTILSLAVNGSFIYWTDYGSGAPDGSINRAPIGGGGVTVLVAGETGPTGLAIDATHIYWTDDTNQRIRRSAIDGSGAATIVTGEGLEPERITADATHLYWTLPDDGNIRRSALDGSGVVTMVSGEDQPIGIAVDSSYIYWTSGSNVRRSRLDGSDVVTLKYSAGMLSNVVVAGAYVYWQTDTLITRDSKANMPDGTWGFVIDNNTGHPSRLESATYAYDLGQG